MIIHITEQPVYLFEGWLFEYYRTKPFDPWPLKKDLTERKRAGRKFYAMLGRFLELSQEQQEAHRQ